MPIYQHSPRIGLGNRRLAIRPVDPDPRAPNDHSPKIGVGQGRPAGRDNRSKPRIGVGPGKVVSQGGKPPKPGEKPPAFAPPVDPRDDQYWLDVTQLTFNKDLQLQGLNTQGVFDSTAHDLALLNRSQQEPLEVQRLREQANVGGSIYSTATQEDLGQLGKQQFAQKADIENAYNRALADRALQEQGIKGQYGIDQQQALATATARAAANELNRPGPPVNAKYKSPKQQGKSYDIPHQKDIQKIHSTQKALRKRVGTLKERRSGATEAQRKAINARIKRINAKRKYLSRFS